MPERLQRKINAFESLLEEEQQDSFNNLKSEFNFVITEKELISALEGFSRPVVRIDRSYDMADELDIELGPEGEEIIDSYEESLDEFFDPVEGWLEEEFKDHTEAELGLKAEEISKEISEAEAVADEYEREIELGLSDLPEEKKERIVETHDFDHTDPNTGDNWGYGFLNAAYDAGSWIKTKSTGRDHHQYEDGDGNAKAFPQDEDLSRRAVLGMGKEALGIVFLGAVADGASDGEIDGNLRGDAPTSGGQERQVFGYDTTYNLSEVEVCAADYQMSQAQQFMEEEGLSGEDVRVSLSADGSLEVYGENRDGEYTEQLFVTDSVSSWTCNLK